MSTDTMSPIAFTDEQAADEITKVFSSTHPSIVEPDNQKRFPVIEVFGPVVQGEGSLIGQRTAFVRFGLCDYRCSWCDTLYAVLPELVAEYAERLSPQEIADRVEALAAGNPFTWVTFSGGNPAIHQLNYVAELLRARDYRIAVETQGTHWRSWLNRSHLVVISPKPPSSGMTTDWSRLAEFVYKTQVQKILKVVVADEQDFLFAKQVHAAYPSLRLYLQPCNRVGVDTLPELVGKLQRLVERTLSDRDMVDVTVLPQLHVLLYGNERGR